MARSLSNFKRTVFGNMRITYVDVNISSYATGGESITPADVGLNTITFVTCNSPPGRPARYNFTAQTLMVYQDNAVASAGPLPEIPATTNLGFMQLKVEGA